jgi:hypothetical protein
VSGDVHCAWGRLAQVGQVFQAVFHRCGQPSYTVSGSARLPASTWRWIFILTGLSPPVHGKPTFIADIDFLFSPSGFAKTLENKYHRDAT